MKNVLNKLGISKEMLRHNAAELVYGTLFRILDPESMYLRSAERVTREDNVNICFCDRIKSDYDPSKRNVLIAIESPEYIEAEGWIEPDMEFEAEISVGNFYDLENYYCPREMWSTFDRWVQFKPGQGYNEKTESVSMIYSSRKRLEGHKMRHVAAERFGDRIDTYGSGTGEYLEHKEDSLASYRFQVVIENGKHPDYVSEKFYDCIKTKTIPIYWGGETAVRKMGFDTDGVIFIDDLNHLEKVLNDLSVEQYEEMLQAARFNRERLVEIRNEFRMESYLEYSRLHLLRGGGVVPDKESHIQLAPEQLRKEL